MRATLHGKRIGHAGFTLVEMLVYLVTALIVIAVISQGMISQSRSYANQRGLIDARESARSVALLLVVELRTLSAAGGDLYRVEPQAIGLRSTRGFGVVCGKHAVLARYGVLNTQGEIVVGDSTLIFAAGRSGLPDDTWRVQALTRLWDPVGGGVPKCQWGAPLGAVAPESVLEVAGDTSGIGIGAPVRLFRRVDYGLYSEGGRWWLGRRVNGAATYEKLTGPLRAPADGGLQLRYFDAAGSETGDPKKVAAVEIVIRAESSGASRRGAVVRPQADSVRTRVALRG